MSTLRCCWMHSRRIGSLPRQSVQDHESLPVGLCSEIHYGHIVSISGDGSILAVGSPSYGSRIRGRVPMYAWNQPMGHLLGYVKSEIMFVKGGNDMVSFANLCSPFKDTTIDSSERHCGKDYGSNVDISADERKVASTTLHRVDVCTQ